MIFARRDEFGAYSIHEVTTGKPVTRLPGSWPLDSDLGGAYEHPEGIRLDLAQVERLSIPIER